ncbi:MAG: ATP-binding protein [Candidatus Pacebacteria bacterium]|nr:ATP-binding protein [Candidatus Paceibacterota bacterium]
MFNKNIDNLTFEDVEWLIDNKVTEDQRLEYKREVWGNSEANKKEMLKDIVSMANRYGGYIIIGLDEGDNNEAVSFSNVPNAEARKDEILSSLFANTQPRLQSIKIKILAKENVTIMAISIPNSFRKPHMITFSGINQFWIRHDRQKMPMSIDEIQGSIINTSNTTKDIQSSFVIQKRIIELQSNNQPSLAIGVSPLPRDNEIIDILDTNLRDLLSNGSTEREGGVSFNFSRALAKPSYNGLTIGSNDFRKLDLHRDGYIQAISKLYLNEDVIPPIMYGWAILELIFSFTQKLKHIYNHIGYDGSICVFLSLYNITNFGLYPYKDGAIGNRSHNLTRWDKDSLEINDLVFTEIDENKITKIIGDRIWQSFGFDIAPYFDNEVFLLK